MLQNGCNAVKSCTHLVNPVSKAIFALKSPILECKKTCRSNPLVRYSYYRQSIPGLFDESVAAIYIQATWYNGRSDSGLCDYSFSQCAFYLRNGNCLFSFFTGAGTQTFVQHTFFLYIFYNYPVLSLPVFFPI